MRDGSAFFPKIKVTIHKEEGFFGPGIAELMTYVEETGSVKEACRMMSLSYSKGWYILNRAEGELGYALIQRNHGGTAGGGASLTEEGKALLKRYYAFEKDVEIYAEKEFQKKFPEGL